MRVSAIFRIAVALVGVLVGILLTAVSLGFFPDAKEERANARKSICENVAVQCCLASQRNDTAMMRALLNALQSRNDDVLSAGLRRNDGRLCAAAGDHERVWQNRDGLLDLAKAEVPIYAGKKEWGRLEVAFAEPSTSFFDRVSPTVRAATFVAAMSFLAFLLYLRRMLQYLDPSAVVPDRVRQALDTLAEGVVIVDPKERIVLANRSFARHVGKEPEALQGKRVSDLGLESNQSAEKRLPWQASLTEGSTQRGVLMSLPNTADGRRTFAVNSAPIVDQDGKHRGALATFDDITNVERKNRQLEEMLDLVKKSRDEVRQQNQLLTKMATCDALTGCYNRRHLFTQLEQMWSKRDGVGRTLGCVMLDIDHFKSINDNHGHAKGDAVLQELAGRLQAGVDSDAIVCRYGGEEFCILLPGCSLEKTHALAERLRAAIGGALVAELPVTSSFGVTTTACGAREPAELLEQADKALYFSKHNGRNRVTKFPDLPADFQVSEGKPRAEEVVHEVDVPFHAVTALLSALSYRDSRTADHSRRVADLCVAVGRHYLSQRDCYVLEVAALLHDIGKIGVPDSILLKPGPLTAEEWQVMQMHDHIGIEILNAAFNCEQLSEIVRTHHAWYGGNPRDPELPTGESICLEARILTIVDAYDAIVSDRVYRKGRSRDEALAELRRCAGIQFDPNIVEKFVEVVQTCPELMRAHESRVSKGTALQVGLHIERLAAAVDARDVRQLSAVADHLGKTAAHAGIENIAEAAAKVAHSASEDEELTEIVRLTGELIDLCRSTQHAYLNDQPIGR